MGITEGDSITAHPLVRHVLASLPVPNPLLAVSHHEPQKWIDWNQPSLWIAIASTVFNPLFWNIVARSEYHNKTLTRLAGGRPYLGCYFLAITIFSLGILRDHLYQQALSAQPNLVPHPDYPKAHIAAAATLFAAGQVLVLTSMWALGVTGTYLGDYFGILMKERVTGFPFNVVENPMYVGSTLCFLATALWYRSPAGLLITFLVFVEYQIALAFEGPFTTMIYSKSSTPSGTPAAAVASPAKPKPKPLPAAVSSPAAKKQQLDVPSAPGTPDAAAKATGRSASPQQQGYMTRARSRKVLEE